MSLDKERFAKALHDEMKERLRQELMQAEEEFGTPLAGYYEEEDELKPDKK